VVALLLGAGFSYTITVISPSEANTAYWFVFVSAAIAICAMILPGISGSFILVLLGMYKFVLEAVSELKIAVILTFGAGAAVGLVAFSNLLSWLLHRYHDLTIAALVGIMIGSLNKIWPWKEVLLWRVDRHGDSVPVLESNVLPQRFAELPAGDVVGGSTDPHTLAAIALAVCGFLAIAAFELVTRPKAARSNR
jgi:putative membrane protein